MNGAVRGLPAQNVTAVARASQTDIAPAAAEDMTACVCFVPVGPPGQVQETHIELAATGRSWQVRLWVVKIKGESSKNSPGVVSTYLLYAVLCSRYRLVTAHSIKQRAWTVDAGDAGSSRTEVNH